MTKYKDDYLALDDVCSLSLLSSQFGNVERICEFLFLACLEPALVETRHDRLRSAFFIVVVQEELFLEQIHDACRYW